MILYRIPPPNLKVVSKSIKTEYRYYYYYLQLQTLRYLFISTLVLEKKNLFFCIQNSGSPKDVHILIPERG